MPLDAWKPDAVEKAADELLAYGFAPVGGMASAAPSRDAYRSAVVRVLEAYAWAERDAA